MKTIGVNVLPNGNRASGKRKTQGQCTPCSLWGYLEHELGYRHWRSSLDALIPASHSHH